MNRKHLTSTFFVTLSLFAASCVPAEPNPETSTTTGIGTSVGEPAEAASPTLASSEAQCFFNADDFRFDVLFKNDSAEARTFTIDTKVGFSNNTDGTRSVEAQFVKPGEVVRYGLGVNVPIDESIVSCVPTLTSEIVQIQTVGIGDVGACKNLREAQGGTFEFELEVVNSSKNVAAYYVGEAAIRNSDGERVATQLFNAKSVGGGLEALQPGESHEANITTLMGEYGPDHTCEVVTVKKNSLEKFFDTVDGVSKGSISSDLGFATGSAELTSDAKVLLGGPIDEIRGTHSGPICVEGFADSVGEEADNLTLSKARADSVKQHLEENGVTNSISSVGYGEKFVAGNNIDDPTERRVDLSLGDCVSR